MQTRARTTRHGPRSTAHASGADASCRSRDGQSGNDRPKDEVLEHFEVSLLTEGSGTQIFSTSFCPVGCARSSATSSAAHVAGAICSATAAEADERDCSPRSPPLQKFDFVGSLIDADMGAYYNWLNQQRLPGAEQSSFLVWFEGHSQALAIGPVHATRNRIHFSSRSRAVTRLDGVSSALQHQRILSLKSMSSNDRGRRETTWIDASSYNKQEHLSREPLSRPMRFPRSGAQSGASTATGRARSSR